MRHLAPGENTALPSPTVTVSVRSATPVNTSAVLLTSDGRVRSDADFVFYNQPTGPGIAYRSDGSADVLTVDTTRVPPDIVTVAIAASLDGAGPASFATAGRLEATVTPAAGGEPISFVPTDLTSEAAVICLEIYRRGDGWKVRAVGQGYDAGLAGLATAFGIDIESDSTPPTTPPRVADPQPWPPASTATTGAQNPPATGHRPSARPPLQGASMHSDLFHRDHAEVSGQGIQKQGAKMCRIGLSGEVMARAGSMVAYQGDLRFEALGAGGIGRMMRQALSGEGVPLMKVSGRGDLFLANAAADVHLIDLDGTDGLTINGANVLAFEAGLTYEVARVHGAGALGNAGMYNCVFTGRGRIAITTDGTPVVLDVDAATYADPNAAVAWSSSLRTSIKTNDSFNLGTLMGRSTGERLTLAFSGQGFVVVQPSELPPGGFVGGTGDGGQAGVGGMLGGFLGR
ncbi:AIM24 family protein [Gordonia sp. DT219]|uniref:AIM24 family protein n=1 Tax=Gordonia sp. DT219 TaxID=3416658 RepID=UPI003CED34E4